MAKVAVFGLGYVGAVSAAALAEKGHRIIGVDSNLTKVEMINSGRSPVIEEGLEELIRAATDRGLIRATTSADEAVAGSDICMVCVGTPSNGNGSLDLSQVEKVCQEIGVALGGISGRRVVVIRSTMLPGSAGELVIPTLEAASGMRAGEDFGVCVNPEFLREGTSIKDFHEPPFTLIGGTDDRSVDVVASLYAGLPAELVIAPIKVAEMVKYACNAFHALKVTFANEIGNLCSDQGIDGHTVMGILCKDTKLNISPVYLKPGFAYGGSCLPKDLRALVYQARRYDLDAPVLEAIGRSNGRQVDRALEMITGSGRKRVGVLGFSFKAGTDDLRESPIVTLAERLIGKGYSLSIFDRNVKLASLVGANRDYILNHIPHIGRLLVTEPATLFDQSDVIVIATNERDFGDIVREQGRDKIVIDLVGAWGFAPGPNAQDMERYEGIAW